MEPKVRIINKETLEETGEVKLLKDLQVWEVYQLVEGNPSIFEVTDIKNNEDGTILFKLNTIAYSPKGIQNYK